MYQLPPEYFLTASRGNAGFALRALVAGLVLMAISAPNASAFNALHPFEFNTAGNAEGWTPANTSFVVSNGTASGTATSAGDPQVAKNPFNFPGNASNGVLIRYRGSHNGNVQLFWGRSGADTYSADRVVTMNYSGNGEWRTLFLSPKGHTEWDDRTITRLRIDPAGPSASTFEIDWLRVLSWDYDNDGVPDATEGAADLDGDGLLALEDLDSDGNGLPDAWTKGITNAPGCVRFDFNTTANSEGWAAGGNMNLTGVQNGLLNAQVTGPDPQLVRSLLHVQAGLVDGLVVRVESPLPGNLTLFWTHDASGGESFGGDRSLTVPVPASPDSARSVYFDLRTAANWKGKVITGLRLDPDFPQDTVISIDSIHTSDGDCDRDGIGDMMEGQTDADVDGLANFEDADSDGDAVSDAEESRRGWNPNNPAEATRDADDDGASDSAEAIAGTDPGSNIDRPSLDIQPAGDGFDLSQQARAGRSYTLERSTNLSSWNSDPVIPQVQGSPTLTWHAPADPQTPRGFFRTLVNNPLEMHDPLNGGGPVVQIGGTETAYLDNGTLRMGTPTTQGGSINFLAPSGGSNLVNWHDPGRLIQQSYYAGPALTRPGQSPNWSPWAWNPIQGGDASGKKSQIVEMTRFDSGTGFFTRTVPLLWDMTTGEKAKAWIDQWNQFEPEMPDVIRVTCRFTCFRDPADLWGGPLSRHQELPACYLIRSLSKVVTYQGANPWTNDATSVSNITPGPPWMQHFPTENWVAMVNPATDVGVGVYSPFGNLFWWVGATGSPPGGETSSQTMHMAPIRALKLGRDSILAYRYWMIHGDLATIRARVYQLRGLHPHG